jgi:hypothetical protein
VVSFTPLPLYPRGKSPGTHWVGGWVDPRAGLNEVEKRKFLTPPGLKLRPLGRPAHSQLLYRPPIKVLKITVSMCDCRTIHLISLCFCKRRVSVGFIAEYRQKNVLAELIMLADTHLCLFHYTEGNASVKISIPKLRQKRRLRLMFV